MSTNRLDRNIVVLGGVGVGKSSVITRFMTGKYSDKYYPTVFINHTRKIIVNDKEYNLIISDTTGQDEASLLDSTLVGSTDVYIVAFSVMNRRSLEIAKVIRDKILDQAGIDSVGIVLAGNKSDLKEGRQVTVKEAQALALEFGCPYVETSAREGINIEELFATSVCVANKSRGGGVEDTKGDENKPGMLQWISKWFY